jgi:hypothetical protein
MEGAVLAAEERLGAADAALADPAVATDAAALQERAAAAAAARAEVERLYQRWAELEGKLSWEVHARFTFTLDDQHSRTKAAIDGSRDAGLASPYRRKR